MTTFYKKIYRCWSLWQGHDVGRSTDNPLIVHTTWNVRLTNVLNEFHELYFRWLIPTENVGVFNMKILFLKSSFKEIRTAMLNRGAALSQGGPLRGWREVGAKISLKWAEMMSVLFLMVGGNEKYADLFARIQWCPPDFLLDFNPHWVSQPLEGSSACLLLQF